MVQQTQQQHQQAQRWQIKVARHCSLGGVASIHRAGEIFHSVQKKRNPSLLRHFDYIGSFCPNVHTIFIYYTLL